MAALNCSRKTRDKKLLLNIINNGLAMLLMKNLLHLTKGDGLWLHEVLDFI